MRALLQSIAACGLLVPAAIFASDANTIGARFEAFNATIQRLDLAEFILAIKGGSEHKAIQLAESIDTSPVRAFYAETHLQSNNECMKQDWCRVSYLLFLSTHGLKDYRVSGFELITATEARLITQGTNLRGVERKVTTMWHLEGGEWMLGVIGVGPPDDD